MKIYTQYFLFLISVTSFTILSIITPTSIPIRNLHSTQTPQIKTGSPTITMTPTIEMTRTPDFVTETQTAMDATFIVQSTAQMRYLNTEVPSTLEARHAHCTNGFFIEKYLDVVRYSNDEWTLYTCSPIPDDWNKEWIPGVIDFGTRYTRIVNKDYSKIWTIAHSSIDYSDMNRPDALLEAYKWSKDGKFVFIHPMYYPSGCGGPNTNFLRNNMNDLYQFNLKTGNMKLILQKNKYSSFSISPDDHYLIYSEKENPKVTHIKNLENGKDLSITLNEDIIAAGAYVWDEESKRVVVFIAYEDVEGGMGEMEGTGIYVISPEDLQVRKILEKDARTFVPFCNSNDNWLGKDILCLYAIGNDSNDWNDYFSINIETGKVVYLHPYP
jgi:hypothetical protein